MNIHHFQFETIKSYNFFKTFWLSKNTPIPIIDWSSRHYVTSDMYVSLSTNRLIHHHYRLLGTLCIRNYIIDSLRYAKKVVSIKFACPFCGSRSSKAGKRRSVKTIDIYRSDRKRTPDFVSEITIFLTSIETVNKKWLKFAIVFWKLSIFVYSINSLWHFRFVYLNFYFFKVRFSTDL